MGKEKPFIVANERGLKALPGWLKEKRTNTYSFSDQRSINVGWDYDPDSDWSKYDWRGRIIITKPDLFEPVCKVIEQTYGWPEKAQYP